MRSLLTCASFADPHSLARHISSNDSATMSSNVERFASRSLRSFTPQVN
jgi:hypothetical protein